MKVEMTDLLRVNLKPGDHLILRVKGRLTPEQGMHLKGVVREWAGGDFPVLILDDSTSFEVVTAADGMREITR